MSDAPEVIQRYVFGSTDPKHLAEHSDGEWIKYADHTAAIKELADELLIVRGHFIGHDRDAIDRLIKKYGGEK